MFGNGFVVWVATAPDGYRVSLMIEKILARKNPGAGALALDLAIKLGITHEEWGAGPAGTEMNAPHPLAKDREKRSLEKAVRKADGVLCFTVSAPFSLIAEGNRKMAERFGKPFLAIDITQTHGFGASRQAATWIADNRIQVLYVDGGGYDASFYATVSDILEATFFLSMMDTPVSLPDSPVAETEKNPVPESPPETLEAALDHLEAALSLKDKAHIANMAKAELGSLHFSLGTYINNRFGLYSSGSALLTDCKDRSGRLYLSPEEAAAVIIRFLWERFKETYRVRLVR